MYIILFSEKLKEIHTTVCSFIVSQYHKLHNTINYLILVTRVMSSTFCSTGVL